MNSRSPRLNFSAALFLAFSPLAVQAEDWYSWRGPTQDGRSAEKYTENVFPDAPDWTYDVSGRGAPVIANGRIFLYSYKGEGSLQAEGLTCFDEKTGKLLWEKRLPDFLSDNAYSRYAIGSPTVDVATGLIYLMSTAGELVAMDRDGKTLWQRSLMEEVGRLSFPNGRTGAPVIVGDLVIVRGITANWGGDGPARDRFYAYQKQTGDLVWASTPGVQPQDSSFSTGIIQMRDGIPVMYATTGCGHFVAINALTGKPIWRFLSAKGGINSSCILVDGKLIAAHDKENIDSTETGGLECVRIPEAALPPGPPDDPVPVVPKTAEAWRLPYPAETSSPVYADGMVFQVATTGVLYAADPATGAPLWEEKLGPGNLHASPTYANGLLYVPILNDVASEDGLLFVIKPTKEKGEIIKRVKLTGLALGPPAIANGKLYICTAKKFYAFTIAKGPVTGKGEWFSLPKTTPGPIAALQALPQEVILNPGASQAFKIRGIDAKGYPTGDVTDAKWESYIPPTAKVRATLDATFGADGKLTALPTAKESAGAFKATSGTATGVIRGRVLSALPISQDFEAMTPTEDSLTDPGVKFAYPPLPWIGGRFKWEVRELDGNKVLFKTLSPVFFQRATTFIGSDEMKDYTVQADMMTDGNRRMKSEVGLINQRYLIVLRGNAKEIELSSNLERIKETKPFAMTPNEWHHLKVRVDSEKDGSGTVRAKAWKKADAEPAEWTLEFKHKAAHQNGSPGFFSLTPQEQRAWIDNIEVKANE